MAIAELHTKKKLVDIKESENTIDKEYQRRLFEIVDQGGNKQKLLDLLQDYEEFLPQDMQKLRGANENQMNDFIKRLIRYVGLARFANQMPQEPDEAIIMISPPMLSMVRVAAINFTQISGGKETFTWGMAFLALRNEGMIEKLMRTQENMYKRTIEVKEELKKSGMLIV